MPMLELTKKILQKVSFDPNLFKKELLKALKWLKSQEEIRTLKEWCTIEFGKSHSTILKEVFV
jgi:hypothetical protein